MPQQTYPRAPGRTRGNAAESKCLPRNRGLPRGPRRRLRWPAHRVASRQRPLAAPSTPTPRMTRRTAALSKPSRRSVNSATRSAAPLEPASTAGISGTSPATARTTPATKRAAAGPTAATRENPQGVAVKAVAAKTGLAGDATSLVLPISARTTAVTTSTSPASKSLATLPIHEGAYALTSHAAVKRLTHEVCTLPPQCGGTTAVEVVACVDHLQLGRSPHPSFGVRGFTSRGVTDHQQRDDDQGSGGQ